MQSPISTNESRGGNESQMAGPPNAQGLGDSPLALELPSWDLVPADTLLIRRRPHKK